MPKVLFKQKTKEEYNNPRLVVYSYIPLKGEIMVELPDCVEGLVLKYGNEYQYQNIYKFKIGDGIHTYRELDYENGTIPAACNLAYGYHNFTPKEYPEE